MSVTAYLWGGGGGGGGNDSAAGGSGSGGGFTELSFVVNNGDVIDVAVGGPGGGGASSRGGAPGGAAGASYVSEDIFDTRTAATSPPVIPSTNSNYVSFLNTYGVWVNPVTARDFDRSYVVNFPTDGIYTFTASADNSAKIYVDDEFIGDVPGFKDTYALTTSVLAGDHTIRIVAINTGGPGSVALTINGGGTSYSGARGGNAGRGGSSGGGGGGGGATVIFKNGVALGVAAGGGGGGGGGSARATGAAATGKSAPGTNGQAGPGTFNGQNGQDKVGDGGGGGGGGGGAGGGNGGYVNSGDSGGDAGVNGFTTSPAENPVDRTAPGKNNPYYPGAAGQGGGPTASGTAGAAVLLFDVPGVFLHHEGSFVPVSKFFIKLNNTWQQVQGTYIKRNGVWAPVAGSITPNFQSISGKFGVASRPIEAGFVPDYSPPSWSWNFNTTVGEGGGGFEGNMGGVGGGPVGAGQNADGSTGSENQG